MGASEMQLLAMRFLELQQRFDAYAALHQEELKEIQMTLKELRKDFLQLSRNAAAEDLEKSGPEQSTPTAGNRGTVAADDMLSDAPDTSFLTL
jgi:HEAT repeat protein